jgi:uncharacterized protein (DUF2062 family)
MTHPDPLWRRWFVTPVVKQLTNGITPEKIAWSISLGIVLGVFPIMGTTTLLCIAVGWVFKLNQPVLHIFNYAMYPLHLALILIFIRLGQQLFGVPLLSFSISELVDQFNASPVQFARDFGMAAVHGICAWLLVAPVAMVLIKLACMPVIRRLAKSISSRKEVAA